MRRPGTDASAALLFLLTGLLALQPLSTDLYRASLPALREHFPGSVSSAQLTLSAFLDGFAVSQLIAGPLSDRFGRRPVALAGCALYVGASLAGMLAAALMGFAMLAAAAGAGWAVGVRHDGSTRPLALGVAACTTFCAVSVLALLRQPEPASGAAVGTAGRG